MEEYIEGASVEKKEKIKTGALDHN